MAINFATETLKTSIGKNAVNATAGASTSDSSVAEFKAQDSHAPATPPLSDKALAELKSAYAQVEAALKDAGVTGHDDAKDAAGTATDKTTGASKDPGGHAGHANGGHAAFNDGGNPLVKLLAQATGETTDAVKDVLQQVKAVLRQEHAQDRNADHGADHGANHAKDQAGQGSLNPVRAAEDYPSDKTGSFWHDGASQPDDKAPPATSDGTASNGAGADKTAAAESAGLKLPDDTLWHDRAAHTDGLSTDKTAAGHESNASTDGPNAAWHHLVSQTGQGTEGQGAAPPALDADLVAAVDHFTDVLSDLHLNPGHAHGLEAAHAAA